MKRKYDNKTIQELNDEDITLLLCEDLRLGMSKPNYIMKSILEQHEELWVEKSEVINIYFDDMFNCCETREEMLQYMKKVANSWNEEIFIKGEE